MPFLLAEILNFQGSSHLIGVGSLSFLLYHAHSSSVNCEPLSLVILLSTFAYIPPFQI